MNFIVIRAVKLRKTESILTTENLFQAHLRIWAVLFISMLYRQPGKINSASEPVYVFLHLSVRYSTDRSSKSLMSESQIMSRLPQKSDTKLLFFYSRSLIRCQQRDREWLCCLVKKLKDALGHQFSPAAAGGVRNGARIPGGVQQMTD